MLTAHSALIALVAFVLIGCQPRAVYVASDTVVGLNANVNTARNSGSLQFGYDRHFATVIPRAVDLAQGASDIGLQAPGQGREVMAVLGCSEVEVKGIFLSKFVENLATGRAARNYATKLAGSGKNPDSFFACFEPTQ
ncbi:MAG: hypothetical protein J0H14_05080 [Alphaproteobacteria bacterium]|nr:hypothetical protein [Alphaproteobacteria bacterium]